MAQANASNGSSWLGGALSGLGSFAGSIGGAIIGAASSRHAAKQQAQAQAMLQAQQAYLNYFYAKKTAENQYSWNRQGLESAGFNPMLAVQNSTQGANSSWASGGSASMADTAGSIGSGAGAVSNAIANAQSFQRLQNETEQAEGATDAYYAAADKDKAEKAILLQKLPYVSKREKSEISNIEAQSQHYEAMIHNMEERIKLDRMLGVRGQDLGYNASIYSANKSYDANVYSSDKSYRSHVLSEELKHPWLYYGRKSYKYGSTPKMPKYNGFYEPLGY